MRILSITLLCTLALPSIAMEHQFSFFESQTQRLRDLQVKDEWLLKKNSIDMLLEKRKGVMEIYQSSLLHLLDMPESQFPDAQKIVSSFPQSPDVALCYTKFFPKSSKAAAICLLNYRFNGLLKSLDKIGGLELASRVDPKDQIESSLQLMLEAVRSRLQESVSISSEPHDSLDDLPENETTSTGGSSESDNELSEIKKSISLDGAHSSSALGVEEVFFIEFLNEIESITAE